MSNTIATRSAGALGVADDQSAFTGAQLEAFGIASAKRGEQLLFLHTVQRTGLDPAARQIYMILRGGKFTIQTGIDGYRLIARRAADRHGDTISYGKTEWCGQDQVWHDVWLGDGPPAAARITVLRSGEAFPATAAFKEYRQASGDMWTRMPANQIAKCAEALALRRAFPQELSGIYIDDEMGQAGNAAPSGTQPRYAKVQRVVDEVIDGEVIADLAGAPSLSADGQRARIVALMNAAGMSNPRRLKYVVEAIGRTVKDPAEMTEVEADEVILRLTTDAATDGGDELPMSGAEYDGESR